MKLHPSDQKLIDFSIKVLYGFAQGLDDVHQMVKHPIDNVLYPVSQFALDAAIILGNTPQIHDDPELRAWQATMNQQEGIYTAACQRMKERMSSIEQMGQAFWAADKLERVRIATRLLTSTFAPGAILRGIKTISTLSENLNTFGTKRPTLFHNLTIEDLPVATTPWKPFTAEKVLGDRTSGFKKYIWVIVKDEFEKVKLIVAERELHVPVLLRNGHEGAYLYHPEISGFKPVYSAGELHTYDGFIQKLTDKTGHFKVQPTWDGYPGFIEKVFQDNGYTHVAGKFEFAEAGVIKQPIMSVDPLGLTPGGEAFLSMMVSTMLRGTANSISNQAHELVPRDYRKHPQQSSAASSGQSVSCSIPLPSLFGLFSHQLFGETKGPSEAPSAPWHARINVPLPSKKLSLDSSDTMQTACAKIDAYFEDIIRNYPESTQQLVREMYYRNKNVSQGELVRTGAGAITWIEQNMFGMTRIKVQIDKALAASPIAIRMLKIHEIAVHAGQFHQRIEQVGFNTLVQGYDEFAKFTEQSVAIVEKILTDALPEDLLSNGFLVNNSGVVCNVVDSIPDAWISQTNSKKEISLDDYVHLQHRLNDKLSPAEHESFLEHPQVSAFLEHTVQQFYPGVSGHVASTTLYRKALEKRQLNPLSALMTAAFAERYPAGWGSTMPQQQQQQQQQPNPTQSQVTAGHVSSQDKSEIMDDSGAEPARQEEFFEEAQQNIFDTMMTIRGGAPAKLLERLENINPLATFAKRLEEDKKKYPNASDDEHQTAALAQTFVEEGLKKGATVGGGVVGLQLGGPPGSTLGAFTAHSLVKPVAEAAGRAANTTVHKTYSALRRPQRAQARNIEIPHRGSRSTSMPHSVDVMRHSQRASSASAKSPYERLLSSNMSGISAGMQDHRDAFVGMGMSDASATPSAKVSGKTSSRIPITRLAANRPEDDSRLRNSIRVGGRPDIDPDAVALPIGHSFIFSTANAAEGPGHAKPTKRHSQEAAPRNYCIPASAAGIARSTTQAEGTAAAIYMQAVATARGTMQLNRSHLAVQSHHVFSTNTTTAHITAAQVNELRHSVLDANKALRERGQRHHERAAPFQAQRSVEIVRTSGELFGLASRVCRYAGNDDTAQFLSSTFQLFSGFCTFILSGSPLGLIMPFVSFFLNNRAEEAARQLARMIQAASQSLNSVHQDVADELHAFQLLLQKEIRFTGALVAEVLAEQNNCRRLNDVVFQELQTLETLMGKHFENTNAYLHVLMTRDLKTKCDNLQSYLNESNGVQLSVKQIRQDLHDLEFWLMSRLHHPMMNGTRYIKATSAEVIAILSSQSYPLITMPGFVASRLPFLFGETIPQAFLSLPPMALYFSTIQWYCKGLEKHPELLSHSKGEVVFAHILETLTTYGELISLIKANEIHIRDSQLSAEEKAIILKSLAEIAVYEFAVHEMKKRVVDYQKRLQFLTDPEQQLEALTRAFFYPHGDVPESQGPFWKRNPETEQQNIVCVIACDEFADLTQRRAFMNKLEQRNLRAVTISMNDKRYLQVQLVTTSVPAIMPSTLGAHSSFFFNPMNAVVLSAESSLHQSIQS